MWIIGSMYFWKRITPPIMDQMTTSKHQSTQKNILQNFKNFKISKKFEIFENWNFLKFWNFWNFKECYSASIGANHLSLAPLLVAWCAFKSTPSQWLTCKIIFSKSIIFLYSRICKTCFADHMDFPSTHIKNNKMIGAMFWTIISTLFDPYVSYLILNLSSYMAGVSLPSWPL